jgi:hypothetical protein
MPPILPVRVNIAAAKRARLIQVRLAVQKSHLFAGAHTGVLPRLTLINSAAIGRARDAQ